MDQQDLTQLEDLVDTMGLAEVVAALVSICHEKADHLRSNWQDEGMAKAWERSAKRLDATISKLEY